MSSNLSHDSPIVFYLDRNLGKKIVSSILQTAGILYEIHDCHLTPDAPDEDWIELCSKNGWVAITRDCQLPYNPFAKAAIKKSTARIFMLTGHRLTGLQIGELIVKSIEKIARFAHQAPAPFLAKLTAGGKILTVDI